MLSTFLRATYEDGYQHVEDEQDHSPWVSGKNIFSDIYEGRPESGHGPLVLLELITPEFTYRIDWTTVPEGAKPIRFKNMKATLVQGGVVDTQIETIDFGYKYLDADGHSREEKVRI